MALNLGKPLRLNYDEEADVLYASIDKPQPAIGTEVDTDVILRYLPPETKVVGVTIINFQKHYPCPSHKTVYEHAISVVEDLMMKYPEIPGYLVS